ncbi:MAG: YgjV family protein [Mycoplasmatota bacterium]
MIIQIIGLCAFLFNLFSFHLKKKNDVLALQLYAQIFYAIHYFFLNGISAFIISLINMLRSILFLKNDDKNFNFITLTILYGLIMVFTYTNIYSIIPACASLIYTIAVCYGTKKQLVKACIITSLLWIIYNFTVGSYIGILNEIIMISSNTYIIIKGDKNAKSK